MKLRLLLPAVAFASTACAQLADLQKDFSTPAQWGPGSLQMQWGATPGSLHLRGDEGMSDKSGEYFGVIKVNEWTPGQGDPYSRSIVSRSVWPLGTISSDDVGKTVKFSALFGWYGGEPMRVQDLYITKDCGFMAGDRLLQGPEGGQDFLFEVVGEKEWAELSASYTIKPEDAGKDLSFLLQVHSKKEVPGFPTLATSDWKFTVTD